MKLRDRVTGDIETSSSWLRIGHEYDVLEVYAYPGGTIDLRLVSDEGTPALFDAALFTTTDVSLPPSWAARIDEGGALWLGPPEWMASGFWEAYFDGDPSAVDAFERWRPPRD